MNLPREREKPPGEDEAPAALPPTDEFLRAAKELGIAFDPEDLTRLGAFLALLLHANTRFNLTAVTDPATAWMRHVLDSLTLLPLLQSMDARQVADIGAGGGLPGIPLAIVMPATQFTLVEATGKKARFLQDSAAALKLENVGVINQRAETIGRDAQYRERYDAVMARAVGRLAVLLELTVPLAKVGGIVLAIKGHKAAEEITEARQALRLLQAAVIDTRRMPTGTIVVIQKRARTSRLYPRAPGEPARAPLGLSMNQ